MNEPNTLNPQTMEEAPATDEQMLDEAEAEDAQKEAEAEAKKKAEEEAKLKAASQKKDEADDPFAGKPDPRFVHLHDHSDYSLLDGCAKISKYVAKAKSVGMRALALTDHGNMFGAIEFYNACKKEGINPLVGCEFYVNPDGHTKKPNTAQGEKDTTHRYHLILIAMDEEGYKNLMLLNSAAWTEGYYRKPRIDDELLVKHNKGLICLSACLAGEILQNLLDNRYEHAKERALWFKSIFGDRYYIELQDHGLPEQKKTNPLLVKLAHECDIPLVATNDIHYIEQEDAQAQEVLLCIGTGSKLSDPDHFKFPSKEFYFKTPDEMKALFSWCPEAIENTAKVAERCHL